MSMIVSSKLVTLKTVSRITQNKSVMKVISNEKKFEFFEFELSEPECFSSVSQSLITELFPPTHKNVYINMAFINSKKKKTVPYIRRKVQNIGWRKEKKTKFQKWRV